MQSIKSLLEAKCQNVDVTTSSVILSEGPKRETDGRIIGRTVILERDDGRRLDERPQEPEPHKKYLLCGATYVRTNKVGNPASRLWDVARVPMNFLSATQNTHHTHTTHIGFSK